MAPKKGSKTTAAKAKAAQEQAAAEHDQEFALKYGLSINGDELPEFDERPPAKKLRHGNGNKENQASTEASAGVRSSKRLQMLGNKRGGKDHDMGMLFSSTLIDRHE
ncbi:hypothetical protein SISSUDRAFT_1063647 [Sistotremastrum suecicum HHB10207 ss-3]|uniref:Uncharacterized protein n=1 Tax=Sistotremastrum suecicum HHB10207 ss-3 TaxID=1314776 RepID=A0A166BKV2_9AGAM|nr:hypothetical protein SISSUDRAFT_1063647 [Sistotremastrum suecicum HHB10207 ss-3]